MTQNIIFKRKVGYIVAVALLLFPLFSLGLPATREEGSGGMLAQMRAEEGLSQADLGQVDPASETMKLATLGFRGIAVNLLWNQAIEYKQVKDWDKVRATLNQIARLQPNFIKVWDFQAHNLAYNISAEFDDYRQRYHWVKKGTNFLIEGTEYNRDRTRLINMVGHYFSQKFGRADERKYFREMFREDQDFHRSYREHLGSNVRDELGIDRRPDNWLVGRLWYLESQDAVGRGARIEGDSPLIFWSRAPKQRINFAANAEEDGFLGETARIEWERALRDWEQYGEKPIPTSWGHIVHLNDRPKIGREVADLWKELEALDPGLKEQIAEETYASLTDEQKAAWDTPEAQRTREQWETYLNISRQMHVTPSMVAQRVTSDPEKARQLAKAIEDKRLYDERVGRYQSVVNYEYWRTRAEAEQMPVTIQARRLLYEASEALKNAELDVAEEKFDEAWVKWAEVFDQYPQLLTDIGEDVMVSVKEYQRYLAQEDKTWPPKDFPLLDLIEANKPPEPAPEVNLEEHPDPDAEASADPDSAGAESN